MKDGICSLLYKDSPISLEPGAPHYQIVTRVMEVQSAEELSSILFTELSHWSDTTFLKCLMEEVLPSAEAPFYDYVKALEVLGPEPITQLTQMKILEDYAAPKGFLTILAKHSKQSVRYEDVGSTAGLLAASLGLPAHLVIFHSWLKSQNSTCLVYQTLVEWKEYIQTKLDSSEVQLLLEGNLLEVAITDKEQVTSPGKY